MKILFAFKRLTKKRAKWRRTIWKFSTTLKALYIRVVLKDLDSRRVQIWARECLANRRTRTYCPSSRSQISLIKQKQWRIGLPISDSLEADPIKWQSQDRPINQHFAAKKPTNWPQCSKMHQCWPQAAKPANDAVSLGRIMRWRNNAHLCPLCRGGCENRCHTSSNSSSRCQKPDWSIIGYTHLGQDRRIWGNFQ